MTVRDALLPVLDKARAIAGGLGFRPFRVTMRVRTWSGASIGDGVPTDMNTLVCVADGNSPRVTPLHEREVVMSAGRYAGGDLRVGPLTPRYEGGGFEQQDLAPASPCTEVFWLVEGPGMAPGGSWCDRVGQETATAMRHFVILRPNGRVP